MNKAWIARKMFEARYPKVAELCRRRQLAYPDYDTVGGMRSHPFDSADIRSY